MGPHLSFVSKLVADAYLRYVISEIWLQCCCVMSQRLLEELISGGSGRLSWYTAGCRDAPWHGYFEPGTPQTVKIGRFIYWK